MEQINSKQDLINYFEKGCKKENQLSVGVEHEKFTDDMYHDIVIYIFVWV